MDKEIIFELNKLILEQTNDLWLIAVGLIAFQVLLIAHVVHSMRIDFRVNVVAWFLSASAVFQALSLMFGYFAKGALITMMIAYATTGKWTFDRMAERMNFCQVLSVTGGLLIFVVAFIFYSRTLARAMIDGSRQ